MLEFYFWILHVEIPKGAYSGQKLTTLVSRKIPAKTTKIIPNVPVITFPKNKPAITAAMITRIIRSVVPMFFFIQSDLVYKVVY